MVHPCYLLILQTLLAILSFNGKEVLATENASVNLSAEPDLRRRKRDLTTLWSTSPYWLTSSTNAIKPLSTVTYRGTFDPTMGPASTKDNSVQAMSELNELSTLARFLLTAYHVVNLALTLLVNLRMIYLVTTKINLLKRPSIIPLLGISIFCLGHLFSNIGLLIGIIYGDWLWNMTVCGCVEVVHKTVIYFTINVCSLITLEATWLLLYPLTYRRSSRQVFIIILAGTVLCFVVIIPLIATSFKFIEYGSYTYFDKTVSDIRLELHNVYGDIAGDYYIRTIIDEKNTFMWLNYWKRCQRYAYKNTMDRRMTVYYPLAVNIVAFILVIFSFVQIHKPSRKKNNFQAALSGKGTFTLADMAMNEKLVKVATMTTIVTTAPCLLNFLNFLTAEVDYNFDENMGKLFGYDAYDSFVSAAEYLPYLIPWCSPLAAMIGSPDIVRARKGKSDYEETRLDRCMSIPGKMFGKLKRRILGPEDTVATSHSDSTTDSLLRPGAAGGGAKEKGTWTAKLSSICGKKNSTAASDQSGSSLSADSMV